MIAGKRYEAASLLEIGRTCEKKGWDVVSGQWIKYKLEDVGLRYCQPDVLITLSPLEIILIEIKLKHTRRAFPQLTLYEECLKGINPLFKVSKVIWCKYFDPVEGILPLKSELEFNPNETVAVVWQGRKSGK